MTHLIVAGDETVASATNPTLNTVLSESGHNTVWNVASSGQTSQDVLNALNSYLSGGGTFQSDTIVVLDVGQHDVDAGISRVQTGRNISTIIHELGDLGVRTLLSAQPSAADPTRADPIYLHENFLSPDVTHLDSLSVINQIASLKSDATHINQAGQDIFNASVDYWVDAMEGNWKHYSNSELNSFFTAVPMTETQAFELSNVFNTGLLGFIHDYNFYW